MNDIDLDTLTPEQEQALLDCYRFIRQRAAWLRAQKAVAAQPSTPPDSASDQALLTRQSQSEEVVP
ncbi:MAG: hypothetical protein HS126_00075 [Anaerolineales bacterium]|nr:hypothetical protein [Anaerolineales bacterium]